MEKHELSSLSRPIQPMPDDIREALAEGSLLEVYHSRPAYQRNDYLAWIARAKRHETRAKRLEQMLDELRRGDVYMKMAWQSH